MKPEKPRAPRAQIEDILSNNNRAKAHGIVPRKSLGQNFLVDDGVSRRIVDAADIERGDLVIEIGPGVGALTRLLADRADEVIAIELDQTLIPALQAELGERSNVRIIHADALEVDYAALTQGRPVRIVANLPYYITSHAIRVLLESGIDWCSIVLTVQLEVAQRIAAKPPAMSLLAVSVQYYGDAELLFRVPPGAFYPPPSIDSATLCITRRRSDLSPSPEAAAAFFRLVKAGFSQPRKQIRNNLSTNLGITRQEAEDLLRRAEITPERRAETLTMDEWRALAATKPGF
jgi:16S rRNA (adenine1518-N6/adenine1519-N6)-dimethyltransferase